MPTRPCTSLHARVVLKKWCVSGCVGIRDVDDDITLGLEKVRQRKRSTMHRYGADTSGFSSCVCPMQELLLLTTCAAKS